MSEEKWKDRFYTSVIYGILGNGMPLFGLGIAIYSMDLAFIPRLGQSYQWWEWVLYVFFWSSILGLVVAIITSVVSLFAILSSTSGDRSDWFPD